MHPKNSPQEKSELDAAYQEALANMTRRHRRKLEEVVQLFRSHADDPEWFIASRDTPAITYRPPQVSPAALEGLQAFNDSGLNIPFDWTSWHRGKELLALPHLIDQATAVECAQAIVMAQRADRINEGLLVTCLQTGVITALLHRMLTGLG